MTLDYINSRLTVIYEVLDTDPEFDLQQDLRNEAQTLIARRTLMLSRPRT